MIVEYDPLAAQELGDALEYYAAIAPKLANRLLGEVEAAVERILQLPHAWPTIENAGGCRRCLLSRFPFQIVYRLEADRIRIYAVAHQRRKPGYWRDRTPGA